MNIIFVIFFLLVVAILALILKYIFEQYTSSSYENDSIRTNGKSALATLFLNMHGGSDKKWHKYKSWKELENDSSAMNVYLKDIYSADSSHEMWGYSWDDVIQQVKPLLDYPCEYIGIINFNDQKTKFVVTKIIKSQDKNTGYTIDKKSFDKLSKIPAIFLFHTHSHHPDILGWVFPSDNDIFVSIILAIQNRYAYSVLISKIGIILYRPNKDLVNNIISASNTELYFLEIVIMVFRFYRTIAGWNNWKTSDFIRGLENLGIEIILHPFPEAVQLLNHTFKTPIIINIDKNLYSNILKAYKEIIEHPEII